MTMKNTIAGGVVGMLLAWSAGAQAQPVVTFEQMVLDLSSEQAGVRLIAATALKQSAYPEAAVPLARAVNDPDDAVQLEAIAGEMNIFLAEKLEPRRRVGLIVEVRNRISAESVFNAGPPAIEPRPVPVEVIAALRSASHDDNPRVALEAMYAFGALAPELAARARQQMLSESAAELAASVGVPQNDLRTAAVRVIGRVYRYRDGDAPVPETVGDAMVLSLNDRSAAIRTLAMESLGSMRYVRAVQSLIDLVTHHERGPVAAAALDALGHIGHPASRELIDRALTSRDVTQRRIAVEALARMGGADEATRISAVMATEKNREVLLAGHFAAVVLSNGPVDELVGGLASYRSRAQAFRYLLEVAPGRGREIGVHIQDPKEQVRLDLVDILAMSGDQGAIPAVERLLQDPEPAVSRAAGRAIVRLRGLATPPQ